MIPGRQRPHSVACTWLLAIATIMALAQTGRAQANCTTEVLPATASCVDLASGVVNNSTCNSTTHYCFNTTGGDICQYSFASASTVCRAANGTCDVAETCTGSSATCPSDAVLNSTIVCRAANGTCDAAETCNGVSKDCPADAVLNSTTVCRAANGTCDAAETCNGVSKDCPADAVLNSTTVCRAANGTCDAAEVCDGVSTECPADTVLNSTTVCRAANGTCDAAEVCDGTSKSCPADAFVANNTLCRNATGDCELDAYCTGLSGVCPTAFKPNTIVCRAANGTCDVAETCTGNSSTCPANTFLGTNVLCRNATGDCDADDFCPGNSADCPNLFQPVTVVCRNASGPCDIAETCTGSSATCPADVLANSTVQCKAQDGICDEPKFCTGTNASCPAATFKPPTFQCRVPDGFCTGNSTTCPPVTRPSLGLNVSVTGACSNDVYSAVETEVTKALVDAATNTTKDNIKVTRTGCTQTSSGGRRLHAAGNATYGLQAATQGTFDEFELFALTNLFKNFSASINGQGILNTIPTLAGAVSGASNNTSIVTGAVSTQTNTQLLPEELELTRLSVDLLDAPGVVVGIPYAVQATLKRGSEGVAGVTVNVTGPAGTTCVPAAATTDANGKANLNCTSTVSGTGVQLTATAVGRSLIDSILLTVYAPSLTITRNPAVGNNTVGSSAEYVAALGFLPAISNRGYTVTLTDGAGATCSPAYMNTDRSGFAKFTCDFKQAGTYNLTATVYDADPRTATGAVVLITKQATIEILPGPVIPQPSPSPAPPSTFTTLCAPNPVNPLGNAKCALSFGICSRSQGCSCDTSPPGADEVCQCSAARGLRAETDLLPPSANRTNVRISRCRWDLQLPQGYSYLLPGSPSNNDLVRATLRGQLDISLGKTTNQNVCPPLVNGKPLKVVVSASGGVFSGNAVACPEDVDWKTLPVVPRNSANPKGETCVAGQGKFTFEFSKSFRWIRAQTRCYRLRFVATDGTAVSTYLKLIRG